MSFDRSHLNVLYRYASAARAGLAVLTALLAIAGGVALLGMMQAPAATAAPAQSPEPAARNTVEEPAQEPASAETMAQEEDVAVSEQATVDPTSPMSELLQRVDFGRYADRALGATLSGIAAPMAPPTSTTITITNDAPDPSTLGDPVTVEFEITPDEPSGDTISGTVTVEDGSGASCSTSVSGSTSSASGSCDLTPTTAGNKTLTATFTPDDPNLFSSSSDTEQHQVDKLGTATTIASSKSTTVFGETIVFTATVTSTGSISPTGTVVFVDGGVSIGSAALNASGVATITTSALGAGLHRIKAVYNGDADNDASESSLLDQQVNKADTRIDSLTSSDDESKYKQPVTFTAVVTEDEAVDTPGARAPTGTTPTGFIIFKTVYTPTGGSPITKTLSQPHVGGDGEASFSISDLPVITHTIFAVYSGDANFNESDPVTIRQVVSKADVTVSGQTSGSPSVFGETVVFTGTVTVNPPGGGIPGGSLIFTDIYTPTGATSPLTPTVLLAVPLDSAGQATLDISSLEPGTHEIVIDYPGTSNYNGGTAVVIQIVNRAGTTTGIVDSTANPSRYGQSVTFTAHVTPTLPGKGTPTGKVFFGVDGTVVFTGTLGFTNPGEVRWTTTPGDGTELDTLSLTSPGSDRGIREITATYGGDIHFLGSSSPVFDQTVIKGETSVEVTIPLTETQLGQEVTINAIVRVESPAAGTPTDEVVFYVNGTPTFTRTLPSGSNSVSVKTTTLPIGDNDITAKYLGDDHFLESPVSAVVTQTVEKADSETILESSLNPAPFGAGVTVTATVQPAGLGLFAAPTPSGTFTFTLGSVAQVTDTLDGSGVATVFTDTLPAGDHTVTGEYGGDGNFKPSDASFTQTIQRIGSTTTLTSSAAPGNTSSIGEAVIFTATVTSTTGTAVPTGTVNLLDGGTVISTTQLNSVGVATFTVSFSAGGSHPIQAAYAGGGNVASSRSGRIFHSVDLQPVTMTLSSSPNPSDFGEDVTFTAKLTETVGSTPVDDGTVTFKDGAAPLGSDSVSASGEATLTTSSLSVGTHLIEAIFGGTSTLAGATATLTQEVTKTNTTITITSFSPSSSVVGQSVTVNYEVTADSGSGTPAGNVAVTDGTDSCTGTVSSGNCTLAFTTVGASKTVTATYAGNASFNSDSDTDTYTVNKAQTSTSVTTSPNPSIPGQTVTIVATVSVDPPGAGTPSGTVDFEVDALGVVGSDALSAGTASITHTFNVTGTHFVTATFGTTGVFTGSTGSTTHTVGDKPSDVSVTKTDSPDPVQAGDDLTYNIAVTNQGDDQTVTVTDTLPSGVGFQSVTAAGWTCPTTPAVGSTGVVVCSRSLVSGATDSLTIVVNVPGSTFAGVVLENTVEVRGTRPDPKLSNNTFTQETTVFRSPRLLGDCNADDAVDENDIWSIVRDIFDPLYPGSSGCDANVDARVDAGDVPCTALIMGAGTCSSGRATAASVFGSAQTVEGPVLTLPDQLSGQPGTRLSVPIRFRGNGRRVSSLAFSVDYDRTWLDFDPTDSYGDGVPDAVALDLPGEFDVDVTFDGEDIDGELDIAVADASAPLATLPDGVIGFIMLDVTGAPNATRAPVRFSVDPVASFGDVDGRSVPGHATPAGRRWLYLPLLVR